MARTARHLLAGYCFHVLNRGNGRRTVFLSQRDYEHFLARIGATTEHVPMHVLAFCLMPNHFHLVVQPPDNDSLSRWMQRLMTGHVRYHHRRYGTSGRIWQGRFKTFPIQTDHHLLRVLRYVEHNPVRANLVASARQWRWSSLSWRYEGREPRNLSSWPVERPVDWLRVVDMPETAAELEALRRATRSGVPYGAETWARVVSGPLGLESPMRGKGRPCKRESQQASRSPRIMGTSPDK